MDRQQLKTWLEDGMSLEQIGAMVGRHPSTVAYWLKRHGLVANGRAKHAPKGGLPREELARLVVGDLTLHAIAERFEVSVATVRYWIDRHGLTRPRSAGRTEVERALEEGRRTLLRECVRHGWTTFVIEGSGRTRCRRCRVDDVSAWRRRAKARLVAEAGGCCRLCGYEECQAALQFHHLDPTTKSFELSLRGSTKSMATLRAEAAKCVLLCANCHAAVEAGFTTL